MRRAAISGIRTTGLAIYRSSICRCRHCSDDLADRGMLDTTLVVVMGEFGRDAKINKAAAEIIILPRAAC